MERKTRKLVVGSGRSRRRAWLATTAFSAILISPAVARVQTGLAADTTPQGGVVVGGSASIAQGAGTTTVTQTSQRTAINWQSFNVGSNAQVTFVQPSSSAIALNRVVTADPSVIAGKINANGQIVLINQSGVVFTHGSQVNAESIVVSTSNITNSDFMAGNMTFTGAPRPGAKIVNNGQLTAREAGLVGLVAPQVANNGVITAELGQVVLAGARAFTLDLYGDRLISLDVTQAVQEVDVGGKTVPALVTNNGLIVANGGKITLTAQDADALVTQLIDAGGTLQANTVGNAAGSISLEGVGGDIQIAGNLLAEGTAAGTKGGTIQAVTTGTVSVTPTAVIDASGAAGGGVVALGTDVARALAGASDTTAPKAEVVNVAAGAVVKADATSKGDGGTVTLLSANSTNFAGTISTQGGPDGGNGGLVEISTDGVLSLSGTVFDTAIDGQAGEILLDPAILVVGTGGSAVSQTGTSTTIGGFSDANAVSYIDAASLDNLSGTIVLQAETLLSIASALDLSASALRLASGGAVSISAAISLTGALEISAASSLVIGAGLTANYVELQSGEGVTETTGGSISATGLGGSIGGNLALGNTNIIGTLGALSAANILLDDDAGTLDLGGLVSTTGALMLETSGAVIEGEDGTIDAGMLGGSIGGNLALDNTVNSIGTLGTLSAANILLDDDAGTLGLAGLVSTTGALMLETSGAVIEGEDGTIDAGLLGGSLGGNLALGNTVNSIGTLGTLSAANILLGDDVGTLGLTGLVSTTGALMLETSGAVIEGQDGTIDAGLLGGSLGGNLALGNINSIGKLGTLSAANILLGDDVGTLGLAGLVSTTGALMLETSGAVIEGQDGTIDAGLLGGSLGGNLALGNINSIGKLGTLSAANILLDDDVGTLGLAGLVSTTGALMLETSGAVIEGQDGTIDAGALGGSIGGNLALGNTNSIAQLGSLTAEGDLALVNAGGLDVAGPVQASGSLALVDNGTIMLAGTLASRAGQVTLVADGLMGDGGTVLVGSTGTIAIAPYMADGLVDLGGTTSGGLELAASLIDELDTQARLIEIGTAGSFTAGSLFTEGTLTFANPALQLTAAGAITQTGTLAGDDISLSGTSLALDGEINATALTLATSGDITQPGGGVLAVGTLLGAGTIDAASFGGSANAVGTLGSFTTRGDFMLDDATGLVVTGPVSALDIALDGPGLELDGLISAVGMLQLESSDGVNEGEGGTLRAATLATGAAGVTGNVVLNNAVNEITTLGSFDATGGLTLDDESPLTIAGLVSLRGVLALLDHGSVTETGGSITAATLTSDGGTIVGNALFGASGNQIGVLGDFAATGNAQLVDALPLQLAGTITTGGALSLASTGAITQTAGIVSTPELEASAASLSLPDANQIAALGTVTTGGDLDVNGVDALTGPVSAANATLASSGDFTLAGDAEVGRTLQITAGGDVVQSSGDVSAQNVTIAATDIDLSGTLVAPGVLDLAARGDIEHTGGSLIAGTLTGSAAQLASFGSLTDVATLGSFIMQDSTFVLSNAGPLTIVGPVVANQLTISAVGQLTLAGSATGGLFITGGYAPDDAMAPQPGDSIITVIADGATPAAIVETGTFEINAGPDAALYQGASNVAASLFLYTSPNGTISFAGDPAGLDAPSLDLALGAGPGGVITGNTNLWHLEILNALNVDLTGTIGGISGQLAAGQASVVPFPQTGYRFNTCPIGSVNCVLLSVETLPAGDPLENFDISSRKRKWFDQNITLPGVAARDF